MRGLGRAAALGAALWMALVAGAAAEEPPATVRSFDLALRMPARTTDRSHLGPRPKTGGQSFAPEILASFRTQREHWEARIDGRRAWRRSNVRSTNRELYFGVLEIGPRWGATSLVLDWQPAEFFDSETRRKLLEQQEVGLKLKHVTPLKIAGWSPVNLSLEASRVTAHPASFSRNRVFGEAQWSVRKGARTRVTWLVESGYAHYDDFFGKEREDVTLGVRRTTRLEMGSGFSLALSIYGAGALSTHAQKSGFDFEVRPEIRWRLE